MSTTHIIADAIIYILAILYCRDAALLEVELWRERKRAELELERLAALAAVAETTGPQP